MITAIAAGRIAREIEDSASKIQLEKIEIQIRGAAQAGFSICRVPFELLPPTQRELEALGYIITPMNHMQEGKYTIINWEKGGEQ